MLAFMGQEVAISWLIKHMGHAWVSKLSFHVVIGSELLFTTETGVITNEKCNGSNWVRKYSPVS